MWPQTIKETVNRTELIMKSFRIIWSLHRLRCRVSLSPAVEIMLCSQWTDESASCGLFGSSATESPFRSKKYRMYPYLPASWTGCLLIDVAHCVLWTSLVHGWVLRCFFPACVRSAAGFIIRLKSGILLSPCILCQVWIFPHSSQFNSDSSE